MTTTTKRGRWYVEPLRVGARVVEAGAGPDGAGLVCTCETERDAQLVAAAPDLLRTVRFFLRTVEGHGWEGCISAEGHVVEAAREAVRKAEGR